MFGTTSGGIRGLAFCAVGTWTALKGSSASPEHDHVPRPGESDELIRQRPLSPLDFESLGVELNGYRRQVRNRLRVSHADCSARLGMAKHP